MSNRDEAPKIPLMQRIFLLLDDLNVRTQKLIELEQSKIPEGVEEAETIAVNPPGIVWDTVGRPTFQTQLRGPWISFSLTNDGPGNVTMTVNDTAYKDTIKPGETRDVNMVQKGKVRILELDVTVTTTVRIAAIR